MAPHRALSLLFLATPLLANAARGLSKTSRPAQLVNLPRNGRTSNFARIGSRQLDLRNNFRRQNEVAVRAETPDKTDTRGVQSFLDSNQRKAALGLIVMAGLMHAGGAHALDIFDEEWIRNFKVDVGGFEIDHRLLVEGVVGGQFIGFIGALVGGRAAKKRKDEVEKLALQLKEVNAKLRAQSRRFRPKNVIKEAKDPLYERVFGYLRMGKRTLKDGNGEAALGAFQKAMNAIAEAKQTGSFNNYQAERKAHRGLGAAHRLLGNLRSALEHMERVVEISLKSGDKTGLGDAYGVLADIYTEIDEYEKAATYYDKYIEAINDDIQTSENLEMDEDSTEPELVLP
eukprot:CAMPEP_0184504082 /NCGR_PEP_ID=MMETSP0113_2-20130426/52142_1 /TAXON_ID=91329 /ORGANISM="Norrisiella sphaerica, Strain BC52" /LENGTH=342 /DNA_ID=CAMNT_0026893697 /DNA_START=10 /DNA_END=1038 /DNA_ORIENTATION=-